MGLTFWMFLRRSVLQPLGSLESSMSLLARKDFRTVDLAGIDASLHPLFQKYNRLVRRMQDLEEAHVKRESFLREEVQRTTRALVEQQAVIARADRLAVSGDLAARMAHRLRSPLSAVQVTLSNLREETESPEQKERLRESILALDRGLQELTTLLAEVRQEPEALSRVELRRMVDDLFLLLGHQAQCRKVQLRNLVPGGLVCRLPEAATRHALMTLLMSAVEADQGRPGRRVCVDAEAVGKAVRITVEDNRTSFSETELCVGLPGTSPWSRRGGALGLAIVRRFADHWGGTLTLENPSAGGAKATLRIPQVETDG
jgi:two-component system C4-dicarboxylate transport sensor histidine kinase DctB